MNLKNNTSDIFTANYPTEELKSRGYKLELEIDKNHHNFFRYLDYIEAEGKNVLIVKLELIDKDKKDMVHVWVRDPLSYLNKGHKKLFWPDHQ